MRSSECFGLESKALRREMCFLCANYVRWKLLFSNIRFNFMMEGILNLQVGYTMLLAFYKMKRATESDEKNNCLEMLKMFSSLQFISQQLNQTFQLDSHRSLHVHCQKSFARSTTKCGQNREKFSAKMMTSNMRHRVGIFFLFRCDN